MTTLQLASVVAAIGVVALLTLLLRRYPSSLPLIALAALPFRLPVSLGDTSANLLVPLYLVITAALLSYLLDSGYRALKPSRLSKLELVLAAFIVSYLLQSLYSPDWQSALEQLAFFYLPFALLFKMLTKIRWSLRLLAGCAGLTVALAILFSGIGFAEFFTRHLFWNSRVIDANQFAAYFRVNSVFFDPNIFGRYLVVAILTVVVAMLWDLKCSWYLIYASICVVLWGGLVVTLSQSSFAALLFGLVVVAALRWSIRWTAVAAAVTLVLTAGFVGLFHNSLHLRFERFKNLNVATSGRLDLLTDGTKLFFERPIWGYGSGSFSTAYQRQNDGERDPNLTASHNTAVTVAAEQGVVGLVFYLALLWIAFTVVFRGARGPPLDRRYLAARAGVAAIFTAILFHTMVYAAFLEDPVTWVLLALEAVIADPERLES